MLGFNLAVAVEKQECVIPTAVYSTLTVANPEFILATAVFEYFPSQIAVVEADFAGFDCHQTTEVWQKRQYYQRLLPILLSLQKNHVLERQ